jgi:arsenate reductase-like glutaredoxin family protein
MNPSYHLTTSEYDLERMKSDLVNRELIPSRKPLLQNLDRNFSKLQEAGISNLGALITALKTKEKLTEFSKAANISEEYLVLLRREGNSYLPNPVPLDRFKGFSKSDIELLAAHGIKHTRHLFEQGCTPEDLVSLSSQTGLPLKTLQHLRALSDLVRAYGVGPVFAELLYQAGIHTLYEFASFTPQEIIQLYQEETGKFADFSISDLQFSLDLVHYLEIG